MFERFTEAARQVIVLAQEEARQQLLHSHIGTEHFLLALMREQESIAAAVLREHRLTVERVREQVAELVGRGDEVDPGAIPFTAEAKTTLEAALSESMRLGHIHIGPEHILLALTMEPIGVAGQVLSELDVTPAKRRQPGRPRRAVHEPPAPRALEGRGQKGEVALRSKQAEHVAGRQGSSR